ncbi:MAG: hypothetical protein ACI8R4_004042, partial [Paracoccaceae bacterium]
SGRSTPPSSSSSSSLEIVIVVMLLQFGSMNQINHTQKIGHSRPSGPNTSFLPEQPQIRCLCPPEVVEETKQNPTAHAEEETQIKQAFAHLKELQ